MGLLKGEIVTFGDDNLRIDIIVYKLFEISKDRFLNNYINIFEYYIEWMRKNNKNKDFIDFLRYLSEANSEIIFNDADFEIEENRGTVMDYKLKMFSEVDGIIQLGNAFVLIKGPEFWIADVINFEKRYYFKI